MRAYALVDDADYARLAKRRWHLTAQGYAANSEWVLMHRAILGLRRGDGLRTDHRNGNGLDNRRSNIRVCSQSLNMQNRPKGANRGSTSRYRGVSRDRKTRNHTKVWLAQAMIDGKQHFLGRYETEEEAAAVAVAFRKERMPFSG